MPISEVISAFRALATATGLPLLIVYLGFAILVIVFYIYGIRMPLAVLRIRKEIIAMNRKIGQPDEPPEKEPGKGKFPYKWK